MKTTALLLSICLLFSIKGFGQNIAVGSHIGWLGQIGENTQMSLPIGLNAEWAIDAKHTISGKLQFNFSLQQEGAHTYFISPEYKYYMTGESLNGFYSGAFMGFGGGSGYKYIAAGGLLGYALQLNKKMNLEGQIQLGYGNFTKLNQSVFHVLPTIAWRYTI